MDDEPGPGPARALIGPGTQLNNTYEIERLIGSGGMGDIYRGRAIHTGDAVALKLIRTDLARNEAALGLFRREASALNQLYHEAIVRYYGFSFDPVVQRHYLAMEFVDGPSLSQQLQRGPLTLEAARSLRQRVAAGLQAAHERGIIHRDVSPDNIIIPGGDVASAKLIDFGIARSTALDQGTIIGGGFAGKYNYVSPEQLGLAGGNVTAKSDIYSFGLVMAEALSGHPIDMGGTQAEILEKRRSVPDLGNIDPRMRPLVAMMLQPDPAKRPASMAEVAAWQNDMSAPALERGQHRSSAGAPKATASTPVGRVQKWIIGGVLGASALALAGVVIYNRVPEQSAGLPPTPVLTPSPLNPAPAAPASPSPPLTPSPPSALPPPSTSLPTPVPAAPDVTAPNALPQPNPPASASPNPPPTLPRPTSPAADIQPDDPVVRIMRYVNRYDGGDCFFVAPVRVAKDSAGVAGFAKSSDPFDAFDQAFSQSIGFSPDVTGQVVWASQCPAVDFLHRVRDQGEAAPILELKSISVRNGQSLAGEIRGYGNLSVDLLQVQDDGLVRNVSSNLKEDRNAKVFDLPMSREGTGGPYPQMLLVVVSPQPLTAVKTDRPVPADKFFSSVLSEAAAKGQKLGAVAKLFLLRS